MACIRRFYWKYFGFIWNVACAYRGSFFSVKSLKCIFMLGLVGWYLKLRLAENSTFNSIQIEAELVSKVIADVSAEAKVQQLLFGRPLLYVVERGSNLIDGTSCSLIPFLPLLKHINAHYLQLQSLGIVCFLHIAFITSLTNCVAHRLRYFIA